MQPEPEKKPNAKERHAAKKDFDPVLSPKEAPGDVPDIAGEYQTVGVDKKDWTEPDTRETRF